MGRNSYELTKTIREEKIHKHIPHYPWSLKFTMNKYVIGVGGRKVKGLEYICQEKCTLVEKYRGEL